MYARIGIQGTRGLVGAGAVKFPVSGPEWRERVCVCVREKERERCVFVCERVYA